MSTFDLPFFPVGASDGTNGKDGVSPTIAVENVTGGHRLIIVDATGRKTVDIMNGVNGEAGQPGSAGQNGLNAVITAANATIDDTSGTPEVNVTLGGTELERTFTFSFAGLKGTKGDKGESGTQGPQGEQGLKGEKGDTGLQGEQGIQGEKGDKGDQGEQGPQGEPGPAGNDGKTPIKGTDYFTDAEKTEMLNAVIAALPKYSGGVS